jgi:hypothetical protein
MLGARFPRSSSPLSVDALYLRPENALALHHARMATHHRDLLTIDELPVKPIEMWHRIKGIALVDHNVPLCGSQVLCSKA